MSSALCFPSHYCSITSTCPPKLSKNLPSYRSYECAQQQHTRHLSSVHRYAVELGPTKRSHHRSSPSLLLALSRTCVCRHQLCSVVFALHHPYPPQYPHLASTYPSQKPVRKNLFSFSPNRHITRCTIFGHRKKNKAKTLTSSGKTSSTIVCYSCLVG